VNGVIRHEGVEEYESKQHHRDDEMGIIRACQEFCVRAVLFIDHDFRGPKTGTRFL
jgi:hypothetical protein